MTDPIPNELAGLLAALVLMAYSARGWVRW